jgi:hypothetical protein
MSDTAQPGAGPALENAPSGATRPAVSRLLVRLIYVVFVPLSAVAVCYVAYSVHVQRAVTGAVRVMAGDLHAAEAVPSEGALADAVRALRRQPLRGFLHANQELLRNEEDDPRMARALALRKAAEWAVTSSRRETVRAVLAAMDRESNISPDALTAQVRETLSAIIRDRRAREDITYGEARITDVLVWLAAGAEEPPDGVERRRLDSLFAQYEKQRFAGKVARALRTLAEEWRGAPEPFAREAAEKFALMLDDEAVALSAGAEGFCREEADRWEASYRAGCARLAEGSRAALEQAVQEGIRLDHPHVYQYVSLLAHPYDEVRRSVAEGIWLIRTGYYTVQFVSWFGAKTTINPIMAVETVRLTAEEHERLMRRANERRMRECIALLGRIGVDYVQSPGAYDSRLTTAVVRNYVVYALESLSDEERLRELVGEALEEVRRADLARSGGPLLFVDEA